MVDQIIVPNLCIRVAAGPTSYPDEQGFSAIYAEITTDDEGLIATLTSAMRENRTIGLRRAMLEISGRVTRTTTDNAAQKIVLAVDGLRYRNSSPHSES